MKTFTVLTRGFLVVIFGGTDVAKAATLLDRFAKEEIAKAAWKQQETTGRGLTAGCRAGWDQRECIRRNESKNRSVSGATSFPMGATDMS